MTECNRCNLFSMPVIVGAFLHDKLQNFRQRLLTHCAWLLMLIFSMISSHGNAATVTWVGGSGDWNTTTNWSTGALPGTTDDVVIDQSGVTLTITHSSGTHTINSITSEEIMIISGGTLTVSSTLKVNNTFTISGGTLKNATIQASTGSQVLTATAGTLDGVTLGRNVNITNGQGLSIANGLVLSGGATITLNSTGSSTNLFIAPTTSAITGSGEIILDGTSSSNFITVGFGGTMTLTLNSGVTIRGRGFINQSSNTTLINNGTIAAEVASQSLTVTINSLTNNGTLNSLNGATLNTNVTTWSNTATIAATSSTLTFGGAWSNTGTITANSSTVNFGGSFTQTGLGTFNRTSGTVNLTGTISGGLALDATTGSWNLSGIISGGTVTTANGAELVPSGGTLSGVTLASNLIIANSQSLTIANGLALSGGATITLNSTGSGTNLNLTPTTSAITGSGEIVLGGTSSSNFITVGFGGTMTLTMDSGVTIRGRGFINQSSNSGLINNGTIAADVASQTLGITTNSLTNNGTMNAINGATLNVNITTWNNTSTISATSSTLTFGGAWSNTGIITASNSTVNLGGSFTQTGLGTFNRTSGTVNLTGTLSGGLSLNSTTGSWNLSGTINGGTVTTADGAELAPSGGTLSGVTLASNLSIANSQSLTIANGLTLSGGATITLASTGAGTNLNVAPTTTSITGSGEIVLGGSSSSNFFVAGFGGALTLTLDTGVTIRGRGAITQSSASTLINNGTISADVSGQTLTVSPNSFTNNGTLSVISGATLTISSTSWSNSGSFIVNNGTLNLGGSFSQPSSATFSRTGGTVNITGTLNNGLVLDAATGSWNLSGTINGGTVAATGGSGLAAIGGKLDGVTLTSDVSIANGQNLSIANGLTLSGGAAITLNSSGGSTNLYFSSGTQTIGGTGEIVLAGSSSSNILTLGNGGVTTLTLGTNIKVRGRGVISQSSNSVLINQGTISADVSGQTITISPNSFTNNGALTVLSGATMTISSSAWSNIGSIAVDNGTLNLAGSFTGSSATTNFSRTNGTVNITGTLSGGLTLNATTGSWNLTGTINGGAVTTQDGSQLTPNGGKLDGVTLNSSISIANGQNLSIANGLTLSGGAAITLNSSGGSTILYFNSGVQAINGTGEIVLAGSSSSNILTLGNGGVTTLTLGSNVTVRGRGTISQSSNSVLVNQGTISADVSGQTMTLSPNSFTNNGSLTVLSGATMTINSSAWSNTGSIAVDNGTLNLAGNFSGSSATTNFSRTSGTVNITGTLSGGLTLNTTTGSWNLSGTINGGAVTTQNGSQLIPIGGKLDGVTLNSSVSIANSQNLTIANGLTMSGGAAITLNSTGNSTTLFFNSGTQTITGTGEIVLAGSSSSNQVTLGSNGVTTLTLGPNITVRGRGSISQNSTSSLINQGTISANASGGTIAVGNLSFSNQGLVMADGGTISFSGTISQYSAPNLTGGSWTVKANSTMTFPTGANITTIDNGASVILDGANSSFAKIAGLTTNNGSFSILNGRDFSTTSGLTNNGSLSIGTDSDLTVNGNFVQTSGNTLLSGANGKLIASGTSPQIDIQDGIVKGNGTLQGDIRNDGMIEPGNSPGIITITGNYEQTANGMLAIEMAGTTTSQFDQLVISGSATINGTLNLQLISGFTPINGQTFPILTFSSRTGNFSTVLENAPNGSFSIDYNSTNITAVYQSLPLGAALDFDGVNDYIIVPTLNATNHEFSLEIWLKYTGSVAPFVTILEFGDDSPWLGFANGKLALWDAFDDTLVISDLNPFPINIWTHTAVTYDSTNDIVTIYINGEPTVSGPGNNFLNDGVQLGIGNQPNNLGPDALYPGQMDEVRIWNTVRTCTQINHFMNCELAGSESGLVAYYQFNQGFAGGENGGITALADTTVNHHDGQLYGFALTGATSNWIQFGSVTSGITCSPFISPVIYVNSQTSCTQDCDGYSWATAFADLQSAIDSNACGIEIWVAAGTYRPDNSTGDRSISFQLHDGVAIYGGFAGTETLLNERDWEANRTILSGDIGVSEDPSDNSYHVVTGNNVGTTAHLDGFIITGGQADGQNVMDQGGSGILLIGGGPQLTNLIIQGNTAAFTGGGIHASGASTTINSCAILGNQASSGGGLSIAGASTITVKNGKIIGNTANQGGGVICQGNSLALISNTLLAGNIATATDGGGMSVDVDSSGELSNCTISANFAARNGGGMHIGSSSGESIWVLNTIISDNSSDFSGTQVHRDNSNADVTYQSSNIRGSGGSVNWDFAGSDGGGNIDAAPQFYSSIEGTTTSISGFDADTGETMVVNNGAAYTPGSLTGKFINPDALSENYLLFMITDNTATTISFIGDFPVPNGTTYRIDDYHLHYTSPCIDTGYGDANNPPETQRVPSLDLEGKTRADHWAVEPNAGSGTPDYIDIGAYEAQPEDFFVLYEWRVGATHFGLGEIDIPVESGMILSRINDMRVFHATFSRAVDPATIPTALSSILSINGLNFAGNQSTLISAAQVNSQNDHELIVELSASPPNAEEYHLMLSPAITDSTGTAAEGMVSLLIDRLIGDSNTDRTVNVGDLIGVRAKVNQPVNSSNARYDINQDGRIDVGDLLSVRSRNGSFIDPGIQ